MALSSNTGPVGLVFLMGSLVMLFFVILSAVTPNPPLNNTYFLQADTFGISGARPVTRWTYFYMCDDGNSNCSPPWAAPPLGWAWSPNPSNAPAELVGGFGNDTTSPEFFFMWRFGWVFFLIALVFEVVAFFAGWLAICGRLGSALAGFVSTVALCFYTIAASLMTATFVRARDVFLANNRDAHIGTYAFAFTWGGWGALLIAAVIFYLGMARPSGGDRRWRRRRTRSQRSYDRSGRRVKDDYA